MYYQRILASRDKESVAEEIQLTVPEPEYEKIIKEPYVLEFLDLPANEHFYESTLEQALINHLQKFLLELDRRTENRPLSYKIFKINMVKCLSCYVSYDKIYFQ